MKIRWILTREARADMVRLLGRPVPLAELREHIHQLRREDGEGRPIWRAGRPLGRIHLVVLERRLRDAGSLLVREIVEVLPSHEGWTGRERSRPTTTHRRLAHAAAAAGIDTSPADVRDMALAARRRLTRDVARRLGVAIDAAAPASAQVAALAASRRAPEE